MRGFHGRHPRAHRPRSPGCPVDAKGRETSFTNDLYVNPVFQSCPVCYQDSLTVTGLFMS